MKVREVLLDGVNAGFSAYLLKERRLLADPKGFKMFRNLEILISRLAQLGHINSKDYNLMFKINGYGNISFDKCRKVGEDYIVYSNGTKFIFKEIKEVYLTNTGYLVGDIYNCCDDYNKLKAFFKMFKKAVKNVAIREYGNLIINSNDENHMFTISIKNTTGQLHAVTISKLVKINQKRKENDKKALPFDKNCDRYSSLYLFGTKDRGDARTINILTSEVISQLVSELNKLYPKNNFRYVEGKFSNIIINRKEDELRYDSVRY